MVGSGGNGGGGGSGIDGYGGSASTREWQKTFSASKKWKKISEFFWVVFCRLKKMLSIGQDFYQTLENMENIFQECYPPKQMNH